MFKQLLSRLFSRGISGARFLALDLGSKSVKVLFFKISDDGKSIEVEGFGEHERYKESREFGNGQSSISNTVLSTKKAIKEAAKNSKNASSKVILGAAGDLLQGDSITKRYIREDSKEKINIVELKNIIQKIQWSAWDSIRKLVRDETGYSEFSIKLINSRIQEIKVDGYRVTNPIGFTGREIAISIFNAYSTSEHMEFLNAIMDKLNSELLFFAAEPYAVSRALTRSREEKINALLLDVGDFTTDITFIQESRVKFIKTIAIGSNIFDQRISREFGVNRKEAESIKIKYSKRLLSATAIKKISHIIQKDMMIWLDALELSLTNLSKQEILPSNIFIYGAGSGLPDIKKGLESSDWYKKLALPRKLQVENLVPQSFKRIINLSPELNNIKNTTLFALAVLALDLVQGEDQITKNLRRISRIIST